MIFDVKNMLIAFAVGLMVGSIPAGVATYRYVNNSWTAKVEQQKNEAARLLQQETEKVISAERENERINKSLEVSHAEANDKITALTARYQRLVRERGMRDPARGRQGRDFSQGGDIRPSLPGAGTSSSQLSGEASEFLLGLAADADRAAQYAQDCRSWALAIVKHHKARGTEK